MSNYTRGRRKEYDTIRILEAAGYDCVRAAGSKGVWDVIGIGPEGIVLVSVKRNCEPSREEIESMTLYRAPRNAKKLVHVWRERRSLPEVRTL